MKIGLLAYHAACNFGAFLQLLSTVEYVKKRGDEPLVINWVPNDFRRDYEKRSLPEVRELYSSLQKQYFPLTNLCETSKEVARVIEDENIGAVIVGSDAVAQHHPFRERFHFPTRRIMFIYQPTSDRMFPNCFWGDFNQYLKSPVPIAMISGSSQDSKFYYISGRTKRRMNEAIKQFCYLSVRDEWTQKMISHITDEMIVPCITPDPVFAFNQNAGSLQISREVTLNRFHLPDKYMLISFKSKNSVTQEWIRNFESLADDKGYSCVKLPYADSMGYGETKLSVGHSVSPLEWYAIIKYSSGYIGNNMHPIVTSITNGVPFYSFDNYGIAPHNGQLQNGESSKIYHILKSAGLLEYRIFTKKDNYMAPSPDEVLNAILTFDTQKEISFATYYLGKYNQMMDDVIESIKHV